MARSRNLRLCALALWAICLLGATAYPPGDGVPRTTPAAVGVLSQSPDDAVLPARIADDVRVVGHATSVRAVVLAAVLAILAGLPAVLRRRTSAGDRDAQPLRARRHTIALRAPPLQFV